MRRFTRLTNGFSKRIEKHYHMLTLYFTWYNWVPSIQLCAALPPWRPGSPPRLTT